MLSNMLSGTYADEFILIVLPHYDILPALCMRTETDVKLVSREVLSGKLYNAVFYKVPTHNTTTCTGFINNIISQSVNRVTLKGVICE